MTETTMTKITRITDEQLNDCAEVLAEDIRSQLTFNFGEMMYNGAVEALAGLGITEDSFENEEDWIDTLHDVIGCISIVAN